MQGDFSHQVLNLNETLACGAKGAEGAGGAEGAEAAGGAEPMDLGASQSLTSIASKG